MKQVIERKGSWKLLSTTPARGKEHIMDVHTMDPFITLWRHVKEELDFYSAIAAVLGHPISIRLLPAENKIEVVEERADEKYTTIYECEPL